MSEVTWSEVGEKEAAELSNIVRFKELGQSMIGKYKAQKDVKDGKFGDETHYIFAGKGADGQPADFAINPNIDLKKRLSVVKIGQICRITYVGDKDVQQPTPMKVFKVEIATVGGAPAAATPAPAPAKPKTDPALDFLG